MQCVPWVQKVARGEGYNCRRQHRPVAVVQALSMEPALKQRLVGAAVLVALAVIFLPMLIQGPAPDSGVSDVPLSMPDAPRGAYETRDLPLVTPGNAPDGGALGMSSSTAAPVTPPPLPDQAALPAA